MWENLERFVDERRRVRNVRLSAFTQADDLQVFATASPP
jgi:hypothetical protein